MVTATITPLNRKYKFKHGTHSADAARIVAADLKVDEECVYFVHEQTKRVCEQLTDDSLIIIKMKKCEVH